MLPFAAAAAPSIFSGLSSLAGGLSADRAMSRAAGQARAATQQGVDTLNQGIEASNQAFSPFVQAGTEALGQYQTGVENSGNIGIPEASKDFSFDVWKDPSAQWALEQQQAATNMGALAGGRFSSGTMKNLQGNALNNAKTTYNDAFSRYLQDSNMKFGQGQTIYQDKNQQEQQKLDRQAGLVDMGLNATGTNQQLGAGYRSGINADYLNLADTLGNIGMQKAGNMRNMFSGLGGAVSGGLSSGLNAIYK